MSLLPNDLQGTILSKISLDEFVPKSGNNDEIIVIGFYATDKEPATDLNTFIQRGIIEVIDTEVSPNPDENGNYLVFVEIKRNEMFPQTVLSLIEDISNLTGNLDWCVTVSGKEGLIPLDDSVLLATATYNPPAEEGGDPFDPAEIKEFFKDSCLLDLLFEEDLVIFKQYQDRVGAKIIGFGTIDELLESQDLMEAGINMTTSSEERALKKMLGPGWGVERLAGDYIIIENLQSGNAALLINFCLLYG